MYTKQESQESVPLLLPRAFIPGLTAVEGKRKEKANVQNTAL